MFLLVIVAVVAVAVPQLPKLYTQTQKPPVEKCETNNTFPYSNEREASRTKGSNLNGTASVHLGGGRDIISIFMYCL